MHSIWTVSAMAMLVGAVASAGSGCGGDDCTKTLTCEAPPTSTGGGGVGGGMAPTGGTGPGQGGGGAPGLAEGTPCSESSACASGFCTDGVCCDAACDGACEGCDAGGVCTPAEAGTDPEGDCSSGSCSGSSSCSGAVHDGSFEVGNATIRDMETDGSGAVVVGGGTDGPTAFGGAAVSANRDAFVVRYRADGSFDWQIVFGDDTSAVQEVLAVAVDAQNNVYIGGYVNGNVSLGGFPLDASDGGADAFVAKIDVDGNVLWADHFGDTSAHLVQDIAVTSAGEVYVWTRTSGGVTPAIDFGGPTHSGRGAALAKLNTNGGHIWSQHHPGLMYQGRIALLSEGDLVLAGEFGESLDLGGPTFTTANSTDRDVCVGRIDPTGNHVWSADYGSSPESQLATGLAVDAGDNLYVVGRFAGVLNFPTGDETASNGDDIFVASFDLLGNTRWSHAYGGGNTDYANAVAIDAEGTVIVTGSSEGIIDFGGGNRASAGQDVFLLKLASTGTHLFSERWGDGSAQFGTAIGTNGTDIIVSGVNNSNVDFGGGNLTSAFIAKFSSE